MFHINPISPAKVLQLQWAGLPVAEWQLIELFSGQGNVSACFRQAGKAVASFDKILGGKSMDITESAGFLWGAQPSLQAIPGLKI